VCEKLTRWVLGQLWGHQLLLRESNIKRVNDLGAKYDSPRPTIRLAKSARSWQAIKVAESFLTESNGAPSLSRGAKCIRNADEETVAMSTYRKFLKIIDRSKARVKKEGSISASELRRRLGLAK
jgi:hypothetical protein